jgi:hypothetical protein
MDFAVRLNRIAQLLSVKHNLAIHNDAHVTAERELLVDDIGFQARIVFEDCGENLAHCRTRSIDAWAIDMPGQIGREIHFGHAASLAQSRITRKKFPIAALLR